MIAHVKPLPVQSTDSTEPFLSLLPAIRRSARFAFRGLQPLQREDAVQEVVAAAYVAYMRLVRRGCVHQATGHTLGRYAVAQFWTGRRVGSAMNSTDVMAPGQRRFQVERLDDLDSSGQDWKTAVLEDRKTPVPDQAAFRCDFPDWLARLSKRKRSMAKAFAMGHSTREVAQMHDVSSARASQLRRELQANWTRFHAGTELA